MGDEVRLVECSFFIPLVANRDRRPHSQLAWRLLQDVLRQRFGGLTGPERIYAAIRPTAGDYTSLAGERIEDESFRYFVALDPARVPELRELLARAANTFDQESIYLSVRGEVSFVFAAPAGSVLTRG